MMAEVNSGRTVALRDRGRGGQRSEVFSYYSSSSSFTFHSSSAGLYLKGNIVILEKDAEVKECNFFYNNYYWVFSKNAV